MFLIKKLFKILKFTPFIKTITDYYFFTNILLLNNDYLQFNLLNDINSFYLFI